jgi:cytochrome c oxidase cbb3-type subunit III
MMSVRVHTVAMFWFTVGIFARPAMAQEPVMQEPGAQRPNVREFLGLGPAPDPAAAKLGEPIYRENCATCHGQNARGAQGPNLVRSPVVLHDEKGEAIGHVVKQGRPQGGMPPFPGLSDSQIYEIAEFIHQQVELAANRGTYRQTYGGLRDQVTGDAEQGKRFFAAHCAGCHSATGDLAKIGARYPQSSVMLSRFAWPVSTGPVQATVTTGDGAKLTGALLKLDDFDVSLRTPGGEFRSWPRSQVQVAVPDKLAGHRALLPQYTDADLHNVTAYLVSLR